MQEIKENIMGTERTGRLIFKISFPIMLSMLIQALYNVVDSIFVSFISENALTAVSLAFPLQNLMLAFAIGASIGVNSLLSRKLGEKEQQAADRTATNGLFLALCMWLLFVVIGLFFSDDFLSMFTDDAELLDMSSRYSAIVLSLSFAIFFGIVSERIMQATGDSIHSMITQMTGAVANIILDPIFIFLFGWGVEGAALATVLGQVFTLLMAVYYLRKNPYIHMTWKGFRPDWKIIKGILSVGIPTVVMNSISTFMVSAMNVLLVGYSTTAVSVFGIYFKLQGFVFMPILGLGAGLIPIIGYNYGARNRDRVIQTIRKGISVSLLIMLVGLLAFTLMPQVLMGMFNATDQMMEIGVPALRIIAFSFLAAGVSIPMCSIFQALGKGIYAMLVAIARQLGFLVPVAWILQKFMGIEGIWHSFSIAEAAGAVICILLFIDIYRRRIENLK